MKNYVISESDLSSIIAYLMKKPFDEVAGAINALRSLKQLQETEKIQEKEVKEKTNSDK